MSQLTGSDEREKRKKKKKKKKRKDLRQRAQIEGCMADKEGFCTKTKVKRGKQLFPCHHIVPPFGYMALSHLACILMPLHSFVPQLPSPSHCVWCQLDKSSFLFLPSSRTSAGLCQLQYCHRHHLPSCTHRPYPIVTTTNPHHCYVNTAATLPIP